MQWNRGLNAGFSAAKPEDLYIPIDPDKNRPNVQEQMEDPQSLYHEVKKLIAVRQANPVLQSEAKIKFVYCEENAYPLAYRRTDTSASILVVLNPASREVSFPYEGKLGDVLYQNGGALKQKAGMLTIPGQTAVFVWEV